MRRNTSQRAICQVDITDIYDHKHQDLSPEDASKGLSRMSIDIVKAILRKLATEGVVFSVGTLRSLRAAYYRAALDMIEAYAADAAINGLKLDRHKEEQAVELSRLIFCMQVISSLRTQVRHLLSQLAARQRRLP